MKCIGIVTDSHGGISPEEAQNLGVMVLPMPFYLGDICCYEGKLSHGKNVWRVLKTVRPWQLPSHLRKR